LRERMAGSVLRDEAGFTRDLEAAYRAMWREWCAGPRDARPPGAAQGFDGWYQQGVSALQRGEAAEALRCLDQALAIQLHAAALSNRGLALQDLGRRQEALASFDRAVTLAPAMAELHCNRGAVLHDLKRHAEALAGYERALVLNPAYFEAWLNRGAVWQELGRPAEAVACYDRALRIRPDFAEGYLKRGVAQQSLNHFDEAIDNYHRAAGLDGGLVDARWNEALCRLAKGDYHQGWALYESRWRKPEFADLLAYYSGPRWSGLDDIRGKIMLLWTEQGLGDALQFCRFAPLVAARGATVIIRAPAVLKPVLERLEGVSRVIAQEEPLPPYDYHYPLMSLPAAFGTTLENLSATTPYLTAAPARVRQWKARLHGSLERRVGLVWSGNPAHQSDRWRSIPLAELAVLVRPGVRFVSLQKVLRDSDLPALAQFPSLEWHGEDLRDFNDTATLIDCLDLVITVDTAVAHLAGALGKPVWVLLYYSADWRWLTERDDSPWYPTARLFRQTAIGDWSGVVARVAGALESVLGR